MDDNMISVWTWWESLSIRKKTVLKIKYFSGTKTLMVIKLTPYPNIFYIDENIDNLLYMAIREGINCVEAYEI